MAIRFMPSLIVGTAVLVASGSTAAQDDYPTRAIRWIVPYSPGGSTSWTSRLVGEHLTSAWGQQVIVDNRPGAGTYCGSRCRWGL